MTKTPQSKKARAEAQSVAAQPKTGQRVLIALLGLGLLSMLFVSIFGRLDNPQMVVQNEQAANAAPADRLGELMQHVSQHPNELEAYIPLVEALVQVQNWPAAETFAERAVALGADDPRPLYLLGIARHNQGRHKEAAEALERVAQLKNDASVRYSLAVLYLHFLNDAARGMEHIKAGLEAPGLAPSLKAALEEELHKATTGHGVEAGQAPHAQTPKEQAVEKETQKESAAQKAPAKAQTPKEQASQGNASKDDGRKEKTSTGKAAPQAKKPAAAGQ